MSFHFGNNVNIPVDQTSVGASPGFTWGKSGNVTAGTWLLNDDVPSNKAGRLVFVNNAEITEVFVACELAATFDLEIYEHTGTGTEVLLATFNIIAARSASFTTTTAVTSGKELALRINNGSAKNVVAGLILFGDY